METSEFQQTVLSILVEGRKRNLFLQTCEDEQLRGRQITLDGQPQVSFSSCSYLGLEFHPTLIAGVQEAVARYGTQFSSSRAYLSSPLYVELEELLAEIFGGYVLVTPSTSMGHQAVFTALMNEKDALVLDHQVHSSVHSASSLVRVAGTHVELVKHNKLEQSLDLFARLAQTHRTVWFACDGVYSMYGDLAPVELMQKMLDIAPNIRLYVDDAHGMSWAGEKGKGSFLSRMPMQDRIVVATSLNKAFAAGGGCLIFSTPQERDRVRMCGAPLLFSGPVQNPMLGAAIASAKIHLSPELPPLQKKLKERVLYLKKKATESGYPPLVNNDVPICFMKIGKPGTTFSVIERMKEDGYFVNAATYPAVPLKRSGIRISVNATHTFEEIDRMLASMSRHVDDVLREEGVTKEDLETLFARVLPEEALRTTSATAPLPQQTPTPHSNGFRVPDTSPAVPFGKLSTLNFSQSTPLPVSFSTTPHTCPVEDLDIQVHHSIEDIHPAEWDRVFGHIGGFTWSAMSAWEQAFGPQNPPEHRWGFHYVRVLDNKGKLLGLTCLTHVLNKGDMLMRANVSAEVERLREERQDPYFLTQWQIMSGTMCSEGNHLFLDRTGPWKTVCKQILLIAEALQERTDADTIVLRDLPDDPDLKQLMVRQGFVSSPMPDGHHLDFSMETPWQEQLSGSKRKYIRRYVTPFLPQYQTTLLDNTTTPPNELVERLYQLYLSIAKRKLRLNVFPLPKAALEAILQAPDWDTMLFYLPEQSKEPVGYYVAQRHEQHYTGFFCAFEEAYVESHGIYRVIIHTFLERAQTLGLTSVHLGMDAAFVKSRFGMTPKAQYAYVQAKEHFDGALLNHIAMNATVG